MKQMKPLKEGNLSFAKGMIVAIPALLAASEWSSNRQVPRAHSFVVPVPEKWDIDSTRRTPEPPG